MSERTFINISGTRIDVSTITKYATGCHVPDNQRGPLGLLVNFGDGDWIWARDGDGCIEKMLDAAFDVINSPWGNQ